MSTIAEIEKLLREQETAYGEQVTTSIQCHPDDFKAMLISLGEKIVPGHNEFNFEGIPVFFNHHFARGRFEFWGRNGDQDVLLRIIQL